MTDCDWLLKIAAFLFDTPEKAFCHQKRTEWSREHFRTLTGQDWSDSTFNVACTARGATSLDHLLKSKVHPWASSSDRFSLANRLERAGGSQMRINFLDYPCALHPLSTSENPWISETVRQLSTVPNITSHDKTLNPAFQAVDRCLEEINNIFPNQPRNQFLALWRVLPEWLPQANPAIPPFLWDHLPAETRTPDHTVRDAALATSTIMSALPKPAFLLFTFGPIQSFIKTSRRTQDFWMGSLLLSWLSWQAIKTVAQAYGPDVILYPDLYRQPFVDWWLKYEEGLDLNHTTFRTSWLTSRHELGISSFPTRFLALLSEESANTIAAKAKKALICEWRNIVMAVKDQIENLSPTTSSLPKLKNNSVWDDLWQRQALSSCPFNVRWVILPWQGTGTQCFQTVQEWLELDEATRHVYETLQEHLAGNQPGGSDDRFYPTHTYGLLYTLLTQGHAARKRWCDFKQMPAEDGEKCTLCGERDALRQAESQFGRQLRQFWLVLANLFPGHIALDGEMLCAVCLTKRLCGKCYPKFHNQPSDGLDLDYHFTSTTGIAAAPFQEAVIKAGLTDEARTLVKALKDFPDPIFKRLPGEIDAQGNKRFRALPVPNVKRLAEGDNAWEEFVTVDGEWLYEDAYDRHLRQWENQSPLTGDQKSAVIQAKNALGVLLAAARRKEIPSPSPYYAILYFDGDDMGKWLIGEHAPAIDRILHPQAIKALLTLGAQQPTQAEDALHLYHALKNLRRPMGPALHRAISRALRNFALEVAKMVVEDHFRGRLVYAGGDELLALLPLDDALPAAWALRRLWAGEALSAPYMVSLTGFIEKIIPNGAHRLLTLMGGATASAGVVYAHYQFPMSLAIETAYTTVDGEAKETLGRDACGITIFKRSGEKIVTGARWRYGALATVEVLDALRHAIDPARGMLSRRFIYQLRELRSSFLATGVEAQVAMLERQLDRHSCTPADIQHLKRRLHGLLVCLADTQSASQKPTPFERLLDLAMVSEFLAGQGRQP